MNLPSLLEWASRGSCGTYRNPITGKPDPDLWYPPEQSSSPEATARRAEAIMVCLSCPVLELCREESLASQERFGIWGGWDETERRRLLGLKAWPKHYALPDHGTEARARHHWRAGEELCEPCRQAANRAANERDQKREGRLPPAQQLVAL